MDAMKEKSEGLDYGSLGFKCGVEIHQQLEGKKLFCNCPTEIRKDKHDFEIVRRLRASAGEAGAVDQAALHEQKKQKYFVYHGYDDLTCAVELDEEPPHQINQDALRAAIQVASMLNCRIVDQVQVMRKTVIDGSNTTGFQRTMVIGMDGWLDVDGSKVGIKGVFLEEEACQIIERHPSHDVYNLSRLGIPLIEIATEADITNPEMAREVSSKIGMILRSTDACKRGIGTIRQDVNLSIRGGARVEIKGFQELKSIPKVIQYEVERQLKLIKKGEELLEEVRKAEPDMTTSFMRPMPGGHRMYPETDIPMIIPDTSLVRNVKTIEERVKELVEKFNLPAELAGSVVKKSINLGAYVSRYPKVEPKFIADTIVNSPKEIKARYGKEIDVSTHVPQLFELLNDEKIPKSAVFEMLVEIAEGKAPDFSKYQVMGEKELEKEVTRLLAENPDATPALLMGKLMAKFRGKVDGKAAMALIQKHKKQ